MSMEIDIPKASEGSQVFSILLGAFVGIGVTFITLMFKNIWSYLTRPELKINFGDGPEFRSETETEVDVKGLKLAGPTQIYIRLMVTNHPPKTLGKMFPFVRPIAKSCRVTLIGIRKFSETSKEYESTIYVDSIPLTWSCQQDSELWRIDIYPEISQFFDLLSFDKTMTGPFAPKLRVTPLRYSNHLFKEHGIFKFTVQITGENVRTQTKEIYFDWQGRADSYRASLTKLA